jgi:hypothetical protein
VDRIIDEDRSVVAAAAALRAASRPGAQVTVRATPPPPIRPGGHTRFQR